jgi:hypothetical protein
MSLYRSSLLSSTNQFSMRFNFGFRFMSINNSTAFTNGYKYIPAKIIQEQKNKLGLSNLKQEMVDIQFKNNLLIKGVVSTQTQLGVIRDSNSISVFCSGVQSIKDVLMVDFFNHKPSLLKVCSFLLSEIISLPHFSSQRVFRASAVIIKYSSSFYIPAHRDTQYSVSCICPIYSSSLESTLKVYHESMPAFGQWNASKGEHIADFKDGGLIFFDNRYPVLHELNLSKTRPFVNPVRYVLVVGIKPAALSEIDESEFIKSVDYKGSYYFKTSFRKLGGLGVN